MEDDCTGIIIKYMYINIIHNKLYLFLYNVLPCLSSCLDNNLFQLIFFKFKY